MSVLKHRASTQGYHWVQATGTDTKVWQLLRGEDRIGQYDTGKELYCRINTDGTLSNPAPRPWRTNPGAIPAPPPALPKPKTVAARPAPEPELAQEKPSAETTSQIETPSSGELVDGMPNWMLYSAGGGLAGLALVFGFMAHGRRG